MLNNYNQLSFPKDTCLELPFWVDIPILLLFHREDLHIVNNGKNNNNKCFLTPTLQYTAGNVIGMITLSLSRESFNCSDLYNTWSIASYNLVAMVKRRYMHKTQKWYNTLFQIFKYFFATHFWPRWELSIV